MELLNRHSPAHKQVNNKKSMKWIDSNERLPKLDNYEDYPKEYIVRIHYEDNPRRGCFVNYFTADDMINGDLKDSDFYWLDESEEVATPMSDNKKTKEKIYLLFRQKILEQKGVYDNGTFKLYHQMHYNAMIATAKEFSDTQNSELIKQLEAESTINHGYKHEIAELKKSLKSMVYWFSQSWCSGIHKSQQEALMNANKLLKWDLPNKTE
jgi:hypothetical protein